MDRIDSIFIDSISVENDRINLVEFNLEFIMFFLHSFIKIRYFCLTFF